MFNVCPQCGIYNPAKIVDSVQHIAVCPACNYQHPFLQLPLFILTGASGTGKSSVGLALIKQLPECVVLESDILWNEAFAHVNDDYRSYRELWLRMAKNIGQNGLPVVLCGSAIPSQFEQCIERRYFSTIYYLALVCDAETLNQRLMARPSWRGSATPAMLESMQNFNQWFKDNATLTNPPMTLCDTSQISLAATVDIVCKWVRQSLGASRQDWD